MFEQGVWENENSVSLERMEIRVMCLDKNMGESSRSES